MDFINFLSIAWPSGFWPSIIKIFSFVGNYAWIIVIFTICLKLVLFPLDFAQRHFSNKTTRAQAKIQPQLEKLKKQYGQNTALLYQKQNELYQRNGISSRGSCIFMLLYLVLTLVIFLTLFNSLQYNARFNLQDQYSNLQTEYYTSYNTDYVSGYLGVDITGNESKIYTADDLHTYIEDKKEQLILEGKTEEEALEIIATHSNNASDVAQDKVVDKYKEIKDSWLWIKNIYIADNATYQAIPDYNQFVSISGNKDIVEANYNLVMGKLLSSESGENGVNGYFILSILVVLVSFLSQYLMRKTSQFKDKRGNSMPMPTSSKVMLIIMPLTMLFFTLNSSSVFSIYVLTNTLMSTLLSPICSVISNKIEDRREMKEQEIKKVDYRR